VLRDVLGFHGNEVPPMTDDRQLPISMGWWPFEYKGRDVVARFCTSLFRAGHRFDLVPMRATAQPAFCAMTHFDKGVLAWFGLPRSLACA
jgi:hypothetical protein